MAKSTYKRSRRHKKKTNKFLLTRTNLFVKSQLSFLNTEDDKYVDSAILKTTPIIALYDSDTKVLFDWSHSKNKEDKDKLKSFFQNINSGTSFTIADGKWKHPTSKTYDANFSGTYYFRSIENNTTVSADIGSDVTISSKFDTYSPEYFLDIPQVSITIPDNKKSVSIIKNILGQKSEKSFFSLGLSEIKPNNIWIDVNGSVNNTGKLPILKYEIDEQGAELLHINAIINDEIFLKDGVLLVNVYVRDNEENIKFKNGPVSPMKMEEITDDDEDANESVELLLAHIIAKQQKSKSFMNDFQTEINSIYTNRVSVYGQPFALGVSQTSSTTQTSRKTGACCYGAKKGCVDGVTRIECRESYGDSASWYDGDCKDGMYCRQ